MRVRTITMTALILMITVLLGTPRECSAADPAMLDPPNPESRATSVSMAIFVINLESIDSRKQEFVADVFVLAQWDDWRLARGVPHNVKLDDIWHPDLHFINQKAVIVTSRDMVQVSAEGRVTYGRRLYGSFGQTMDLHAFPFDRQTLKLQLTAPTFLARNLEIRELVLDDGRRSSIAPKVTIPDWRATAFAVGTGTYSVLPGRPGVPIITASIEVRRDSRYYIFKMLIPLLLIVAISWVTFWFPVEDAADRIGVPVTTMLTLVAYRFAIGELLPNVSYMTHMDLFILGSMVLVFLVICYVVSASTLVRRDRRDVAVRFRHWGRIAFPILAAALTFVTMVLV